MTRRHRKPPLLLPLLLLPLLPALVFSGAQTSRTTAEPARWVPREERPLTRQKIANRWGKRP